MSGNKSSSPFCTCDDHDCEFNPVNHNDGCNRCVEDSIKTNEIPKCFFLKTGANLDGWEDWSFEGFATAVNTVK
ncbi:MAG: DUF6485 family protein [Anaerovoracaceae bacterium]